MKTFVITFVFALVALGVVAGAAEAAPMWTGCHPYWDGESWDPVYGPDGRKVAKVPRTETLCY